MGEFLTDIVDWMSALPVLWAYGLILLIAYGENVIPPIPGDMIIVFGGYLVGLGRLDFTYVILLATVGGIAGFMTMYAIGHRIGAALLEPDRMRWVPKKRLNRAREYLEKWGFRFVAANRFLSGLRSVISLSVGMAHMPPGRTTLWCSVSALLWTVLLTILGYFVGENWPLVKGYLQAYGWAIMALIVVVGLIQFLLFRRSKMVSDPSE